MARTNAAAVLSLCLLAGSALGCEKILGLQRAVLYQPDAGSGGAGGAAPSCTDSVKNANETDVDCGGGTCPPCSIGEGCIVGTDCESHACSGIHVCVPALCDDMAQNSGESDIDCGGPDCSPCAVGQKCNQPEDCVSLACDAGICTGECTPGEKQCAGNIPQTCSATWHWDSGAACEGAAPQCCDAACLTVTAEVAAGNNQTCVQKTDASLWCWGDNGHGQLGDGTNVDKSSPVQVSVLGKDVAQVVAGGSHTCVRKLDGTLWCWGDNGNGQLGDGTIVDKSAPVQVSALGTTVVEAAASSLHRTCARKTDGTLWCWGANTIGALGDGTTVNKSSPVQVTALGTAVAEIAAGGAHTCARKTDGTLWCWGGNSSGTLGDGTTTSSPSPVQVTALGTTVAEVAAGGSHTCARTTAGAVWCWGYNYFGQVGDGTTTDRSSPVQLTALGSAVAALAAGNGHTCARKTDATLWCWGNNDQGQLGDGTKINSSSPVQVMALGTTVAGVAAGGRHTCAHKTDATLWCWGSNGNGQLGDGTTLAPWVLPKRLSLGACEMDHCGSGAKDGDETDVDCGGPTCNALGKTCWEGSACAAPEDCASKACVGQTCQAQ